MTTYATNEKIDWEICKVELGKYCLNIVEDKEKHNCLGKIDSTVLGKDCLMYFKSLCSKYGKKCGRHRPIIHKRKLMSGT